MVRNYFRIALRNLLRNKGYAFINIFGLAIGLAGCTLIIGYLAHELSFEDCHKNRDRIYRVQGYYATSGSQLSTACAVPALAPALVEECPEVETAARFRWNDVTFEINHEKFDNYRMLCASPELFQVFTIPLVMGDERTALNSPFSALISEDLCRQHFSGMNPMGMTFKIMDSLECQITGVMKNLPSNTQLRCDLLVSYASLEKIGVNVNAWDDLGKDYVYVLLKEKADPKAVEEKIPALFSKHLDKEIAKRFELHLEPLKNIYLHSNSSWELQPNGDMGLIYVFSLVAAFLLAIASSNFVNLATARTVHRMKEVGVRKVLGATRPQLMKQFLGESMIVTVVAMLLGMVFFEIFKPQMEAYIGRKIVIDWLGNPLIPLAILTMILVVGLLSGSFPALYLSRFQPLSIIKQGTSGKRAKSISRMVLVVFQFIIAIGLILCTITIFRQVRYLHGKDLGFDRDNILVMELGESGVKDKCLLLKNEIQSRCRVQEVAALYSPPGHPRVVLSMLKSSATPENEAGMVKMAFVDQNYLKTFGIQLLQGSNFTQDNPDVAGNTVIINEAAVKEFELKDPIGQRFLAGENSDLQVVGVVRNFNDQPLKNPLSPLFLRIAPNWYRVVAVRLFPGDDQVIADIKKIWESIMPGAPFKYSFLDEIIKTNYNDEAKLGNLFSVFALLAILIACLGIIGLSSFMVESRTKEIGIRKVLGATVANVLSILSKEFIILIVIACGIASPIAWSIGNSWLNDYAYRVDISWWTYILAGLIALAVALASVSYQAFKAASINPVKSLRYE